MEFQSLYGIVTFFTCLAVAIGFCLTHRKRIRRAWENLSSLLRRAWENTENRLPIFLVSAVILIIVASLIIFLLVNSPTGLFGFFTSLATLIGLCVKYRRHKVFLRVFVVILSIVGCLVLFFFISSLTEFQGTDQVAPPDIAQKVPPPAQFTKGNSDPSDPKPTTKEITDEAAKKPVPGPSSKIKELLVDQAGAMHPKPDPNPLVVSAEFWGTIKKVDGNKLTVMKGYSKKKGEKREDVTLIVAENVKVVKARFNKATKKIEAGDTIKNGLKNELFTYNELFIYKDAWITTNADGKINQIMVRR